MLDWQKFCRLLISSLPLQALGIGLLTTLLSAMLWSAAPATFTALEDTVYDSWLRHRTTAQVSPLLTIVTRDVVSEERFGRGLWDRGILAQLIVTIHEAGAAVIGLDHRLDYASPAQLGGAASDALFFEALRTASPVVLIHDTDVLLQSDTASYGHLTVTNSLDHVSRHIPPSTKIGTQGVPAFGSILSDIFHRHTATPTQVHLNHSDADVLINFVGDGSLAALQPIPLSSVWNAVERHDEPLLVSWFKDKAVVIRSSPGGLATWLLPSNSTVDGLTIHLHVLNALLNHERIDSLGWLGRLTVTIVLALAAWSLLQFRGMMGLLLAGAVVVLYGALAIAMLSWASLVMPIATPLAASVSVFIGTAVWVNLTASQRLILLERDMIRIQQESAAVREALVLHEDRAEALQEDLDTANAAIDFSAGQQEELTRTTHLLRLQIVEAQGQEQEARRHLRELERQR